MSAYESPLDRQWRIDRASGWLRTGGSVLLVGAAPIEDSVDTLTAIAARAGARRVLRCTASRPTQPYHAVTNLLSTITDADLAPLPEPQRAVLSGAPFRPAPQADYFTPAAVRLAVLNLCRRLARTGPLLLVPDNLHHIDAGSADVLRFLARAGAGLPIQVLASEHLTSATRSVGHRLCLRPLLVLGLGDALTLTNPHDARP